MNVRNMKKTSRKDDAPTDELAGTRLANHWKRLHEGDREPYPSAAHFSALARNNSSVRDWLEQQRDADTAAERLLQAWQAFHQGDFQKAIAAGAALDAPGITVANKAAGVLATYSHAIDSHALDMLKKAVARGEQAVRDWPSYANAHYMLAFVLGRYSQRISILQALAEGHATKVRKTLERCLELEPAHGDAHIALGVFHAEVVGKLGSVAAGLTYGVSKAQAINHLEKALQLTPHSIIARVEYARALGLLDRGSAAQRTRLLKAALKLTPMDAMERLDHERAQHDLDAC
jgi:tetratricopeptide (TPR) repeat protein